MEEDKRTEGEKKKGKDCAETEREKKQHGRDSGKEKKYEEKEE